MCGGVPSGSCRPFVVVDGLDTDRVNEIFAFSDDDDDNDDVITFLTHPPT